MNPTSTPQFIIDERGEKTAVILSIAAYTELMEDLSDLTAAVERRNEDTISHEELLADLKADGLL